MAEDDGEGASGGGAESEAGDCRKDNRTRQGGEREEGKEKGYEKLKRNERRN